MSASSSLPLNRALLRPGERICVGVSGGADSTALLLALSEQAADLGIGLSAAHLHHGIRGAEADGDVTFLTQLCEKLDLPLHLQTCPLPRQLAPKHWKKPHAMAALPSLTD